VFPWQSADVTDESVITLCLSVNVISACLHIYLHSGGDLPPRRANANCSLTYFNGFMVWYTQYFMVW
jgi:hypothetical protein